MFEVVVSRWKNNQLDDLNENFRKEQLWTYQVELVLSMNEENLLSIYKNLCVGNKDSDFKRFGEVSVTPEVCDQFFR